jgi:hypothetical protein
VHDRRVKTAAFLISALLLVASAAQAQREGPTPQSPENIKAECWMKYDKERKLSLDQRLALVEKCVQARQINQPPR